MTEVWFAGRVEGGVDEDAFLDEMRRLAPCRLTGLIGPDATGAHPYGCVLVVEVPGVPPRENPVTTNQLQVLYSPGFVGGYWGCAHLWDDFDPADPDALHVAAGLTPQEAADTAVGWLAAQLTRPRVLEEWDRRWLGPAQRWVLSDTGRALGGRGRPPRGRPDPDRVIPLAP